MLGEATSLGVECEAPSLDGGCGVACFGVLAMEGGLLPVRLKLGSLLGRGVGVEVFDPGGMADLARGKSGAWALATAAPRAPAGAVG